MKFNILKRNANSTLNHEEAAAYSMSPEMELYAAVSTAALSDTFYEKGSDRLARIQDLMLKNDPEYIARLAIYARHQMHLRSIPMVLAVEMAKRHAGTSLVSKTIHQVVKRADEITELLAYYQLANKRHGVKKLNRLSKQVQKGLSLAFNQFDEYQFAKYDRSGEIRLRDALFLVHPKAKDERQQVLFNKIAAGTLATPYTWETELSALGQQKFETMKAKNKAFTAKWEELIDSGQLGYMALLRNLRNILEADVSGKHIGKVCATLSDSKAVANSKQLPFRFLAAYRELSSVSSWHTSKLLNALEDAVSQSVVNMKGFDKDARVLIACDVSGSMQKPISPKSKILLYDIGLMLAMLLQSKCEIVISGMFGDKWKVVNMPSRNVLANVTAFYKREGEVGYATNGHLVIEDLIKRKLVMDKVVLFTDCQLWNSKGNNHTMQKAWMQYKLLAPAARLYLFDLAGYGTTPVTLLQKDVWLIAGWSDKVFDVLDALENGNSAVEVIKQLPL